MTDETETEQEQQEAMMRVRFKGPRDPANRTEVIKLRGRDDIPVDGEGDVTSEEYDVLVNHCGLVLEHVQDEDASEPVEVVADAEPTTAVAAESPSPARRPRGQTPTAPTTDENASA